MSCCVLNLLSHNDKANYDFFFFLRPLPQHMEVPRLGVYSELQLLLYGTAMPDPRHVLNLHHSSPERQVLNPQSRARDQTQVLMDTSWISYY